MSLKYEVFYNLYNGFFGYYRHDVIHRVGGPSDVWTDGDMFWVQYGKGHRIDGPAINHRQMSRYYIWDVEYTKEEYESKIRTLL